MYGDAGYPRDCELCGEELRLDENGLPRLPELPGSEIGEFWNPNTESSVIAHAQCGIDARLELA